MTWIETKPPEPFPRSSAIEFEPGLETAMSSFPSLLKSATAIALGLDPTENITWGWNVPSPFPSAIETLFEPELAIARSGLPSALKSAIETQIGELPATTLGIAR